MGAMTELRIPHYELRDLDGRPKALTAHLLGGPYDGKTVGIEYPGRTLEWFADDSHPKGQYHFARRDGDDLFFQWRAL